MSEARREMPQPIDLALVRTVPLQQRANKVALERFAAAAQPGRTAAEFVDGLPRILAGEDFRAVVEAIVKAHQARRPVIVGLGAHVIKCGLNPVLIDLMRRGIVTALATNGAGAIHDFELALIGETSEDVAAGLADGTFGMVRETGELINRAVNRVHEKRDAGMGALLSQELELLAAPNREYSLLAAARRWNIPFTVHVAVGTDIVHMHASADGGAIGQATFNDFRLFAAVVAELSGGVYLNIGSAVLMPEVFLKAFTVAQNLGAQNLGAKLHDFVTVNLDMIGHYRSGENVVRRPPQVGGRGYSLIGRHEIMLPLLAQAVVDRLAEKHRSVSKVMAWEELAERRQHWRTAGRRVVWTNGCFDLLHVGHLQSLRAARALGDVLVVGVNGDASVRQLKGPQRPIVPAAERAELLAALDCVDAVVVFDEATPEAALARLKPDIHCKGAEYAPPNGKPVPEAALVASFGGQVQYLSMVPGISTTDLVQRVQSRLSDDSIPTRT